MCDVPCLKYLMACMTCSMLINKARIGSHVKGTGHSKQCCVCVCVCALLFSAWSTLGWMLICMGPLSSKCIFAHPRVIPVQHVEQCPFNYVMHELSAVPLTMPSHLLQAPGNAWHILHAWQHHQHAFQQPSSQHDNTSTIHAIHHPPLPKPFTLSKAVYTSTIHPPLLKQFTLCKAVYT